MASGTSVAAPMVAGGLAVMKQLFRNQLANTSLVERLYRTLNRDGPYGDRAVYGRGLMDLGSATSPVGPATVTMGQRVDGTGFDVRSTGLRPGQAFGDGLTGGLADREMVAFDQLGAPFRFRLSAFAVPAYGPTLSARLDDLLSGGPETRSNPGVRSPARSGWNRAPDGSNHAAARWQFGGLDPQIHLQGGHLSAAQGAIALGFERRHGLNAAAFTTAGSDRRSPATGLNTSYRLRGLPVAIRAGWLTERRTLLGTAPAGGFGRLSASMVFGGVQAEFQAGGCLPSPKSGP